MFLLASAYASVSASDCVYITRHSMCVNILFLCVIVFALQ